MIQKCLAAAILLTVLPAPVSAGDWFDLGAAASDTIRAEQDGTCWEVYPPNAFGVFPLGSWVWQEVNVVECASLRWPDQVCWNTPMIRAFQVEFNDGGCGCGGFVERPSTLCLTYNPLDVLSLGIPEASLRVIYNDPDSRSWQLVEGVFPDTQQNHFQFTWNGEILGIREYAIVTADFVATEPTTWSHIKSRYAP